MAQQFTTASNSSNPYVSYIVNNMNLIITLNNKRKKLNKEIL